MFLFTKRTKKVIKWFWGVFAVLVILSMVFTYSGFTMLARTTPSTTQDIPPEVLAELEAQQQATNTPEVQALLEQVQVNASGTVEVTEPTIERTAEPEPTPVTPPVPPLQFEL